MINQRAGKRRKAVVAVLAACSGVVLAGAQLHAAIIANSWTVAGGGSWATAANWNGGHVPTTGEAATFTSALPVATNAITLDGDQDVYSLQVTTGGGTKVVQITAGTPTTSKLILISTDTTTGSGAFTAVNASGGMQVNAPVQLGDGTTSGGVATFNSTQNASTVIFNGDIADASGQTWGVRITGNGTGIVNYGTTGKTYSGDTTIATTGILKLNTDNQIPNGAGKGNVVIEGSGQLQFNNTGDTINGLSSSSSTSSVTKSGSSSKTFTVGDGNATASFAGTISITGGSAPSVSKIGTGTQTFGGNVTTTAFSVSAGTALVHATLTAATINVAAAGTLGGYGTATLTGATTINGTVSPGASAGTLDISSTAVNFNNNSALTIELGGNTPGDNGAFYDQLNATNAAGTLALTGTVTLNVSLIGGFTPAPTDVFYILTRADAGAFTTMFAGLAEGSPITVGGYTGNITYLANWTGTQGGSTTTGGNDVAITNLAAVPEPTSLGLLAGAGLLTVKRRRKGL